MSDLPAQTGEIFARNDEFDEDDEQSNVAHQIVPKDHRADSIGDKRLSSETAASATPQFKYDVEKILKTDKDTHLYRTFPKDHIGFVPCRIRRHKSLSTTFHMYFEGQNENDLTFLLAARKHLTMGGHSEYFIGVDETATKSLNDGNSIAVLKGTNFSGNEYILYDQRFCSTHPQNKEQLAAILYNEHILGSKEPRKITVLLRDPEQTVEPTQERETLIGQWRSGRSAELIEIRNKPPNYDEESKQYSLDFLDNRVKRHSHKNFQLSGSTVNAPENVIMQFGRIDDHDFALDYRYPLTAVQAFGIALSSFHNRFRT